MSELDRLTSRSLSGVPMRARELPPEQSQADIMARSVLAMANLLAGSQEKMTAALADALTSRGEPARGAVSMDLTRGKDGNITGGTVTNGAATWNLSVERIDGRVRINALPG